MAQRERVDTDREAANAHRRPVESTAAAVRERMESSNDDHHQQELAERILRSHSFAQEFVKPRMDATFLVDNYTAPALAAAYQDRCVCIRYDVCTVGSSYCVGAYCCYGDAIVCVCVCIENTHCACAQSC